MPFIYFNINLFIYLLNLYFLQKLPNGLIVAVCTLPYITVEEDKAPELCGEMDLSNMGITETGAMYPDRINGVVSDFMKWGVLTN